MHAYTHARTHTHTHIILAATFLVSASLWALSLSFSTQVRPKPELASSHLSLVWCHWWSVKLFYQPAAADISDC